MLADLSRTEGGELPKRMHVLNVTVQRPAWASAERSELWETGLCCLWKGRRLSNAEGASFLVLKKLPDWFPKWNGCAIYTPTTPSNSVRMPPPPLAHTHTCTHTHPHQHSSPLVFPINAVRWPPKMAFIASPRCLKVSDTSHSIHFQFVFLLLRTSELCRSFLINLFP